MFSDKINQGNLDYYPLGLTHLEWDARINHGQMPYHSVDMTDLGFRHMEQELITFRMELEDKVQQYPRNMGFQMLLAFVLDVMGEDCQANYELVAEGHGGIAKMVQYDWLESIPGINHLPAVVEVREVPKDPDHILMVAVNQDYAQKYLAKFVETYFECSNQGLLVHLMDCEYGFVHEVKQKHGFGITAEWPSAGRNYYHAARFIRMATFLSHYKRKIWLCDADVLFHGDMEEIWNLPGSLVWRARPGRFEPWNQVNACLFGCSDWRYAGHVAGYIDRLAREDRMFWGADQMAMWATYKMLVPLGLDITCLDDIQLCYDDRPEAIVSAYSGARKRLLDAA